MSGLRFDITLANGRRLSCVRIQGNGGELGAGLLRGSPLDGEHRKRELESLRIAIRMMEDDRPSPLFEPIQGHAKLYHGRFNDEVTEIVDLRGAKVERPRWS